MTRILHWVLVLTMPFLLGFSVMTLVISPWYPTWEYGKEDFPADSFGFTQEQRLELALVAVDYLERWDSAENTIYLLEEQTLPGTSDPLYLPSEISHMVDVKVLSNLLRIIAIVLAIVTIASLVWFAARGETQLLYRTLMRGGIATVAILLAIGLFIVAAWDVFFVQFHELLFPPGTWTFNYSDSLIRLFPERFWQDVGILIVGSTLVSGIVLAVVGYFALRRNL